MTDLRQHPPPPYEHIRHSPEDHYILAQQYNNSINPPPHHMLGEKYPMSDNNINAAVYRSENPQHQQPIEYNRDQQMYHQLEGAENHKGIHHLADINVDYDETISNNDDNSNMKDLSPVTDSSKLDDPKAYTQSMRTPSYANNSDKSNYDYAGNAIRARNFKDMQSPAESSEGTEVGVGNYQMEAHDSEENHRLSKDGGNGELGNNLRTYPSSEDLNQTMSSDHGGEKITSGSDDEGESSSFGGAFLEWNTEIKLNILSSR